VIHIIKVPAGSDTWDLGIQEMFGNYIGAMKKEKVFIMCINK
jgi:hypothetical protein